MTKRSILQGFTVVRYLYWNFFFFVVQIKFLFSNTILKMKEISLLMKYVLISIFFCVREDGLALQFIFIQIKNPLLTTTLTLAYSSTGHLRTHVLKIPFG